MPERFHRVRQIRIDVPLRATYAYLFVNPDDGERWDPWWTSLYSYLLRLSPSEPKWEYEPVQNIFTARPLLNDEQRMELLRVLQGAPAHEIGGHRTLARAVSLTPENAKRLEVMYFATVGGDQGDQGSRRAGGDTR